MIHTDGIPTIANGAGDPPKRKATEAEVAGVNRAHDLVEKALTEAFGPPGTVTKIDLDLDDQEQ